MTTGRSWALYGQLQVFTLNTILSALNLQKVTGILTLAQFDQMAQVMVRDGEVVDAWSSTERGLAALLPLFGWEEGFFTFDVQPPVDTQTINISLPVLQVRSAVYLEDQKRKKQVTSIFTREVPSADHVLEVNPDSDSEVTIQPEQWTILRHLVAGPQPVRKVAELLDLPLEAFVPVASELVRNRMLRVLAPERR